jgi:hypothetical protein
LASRHLIRTGLWIIFALDLKRAITALERISAQLGPMPSRAARRHLLFISTYCLEICCLWQAGIIGFVYRADTLKDSERSSRYSFLPVVNLATGILRISFSRISVNIFFLYVSNISVPRSEHNI